MVSRYVTNKWSLSTLRASHRLPPDWPPPDWPPPSTPPISLYHCLLQVHLQTRSIMASEGISEFTQSRSPIASPSRSITTSKCISNLARSMPASVSLSSLDLDLQVHLQTRSITASLCISEFTQSRFPIASPNSLNHGLPVHLWVHSISISNWISKLAQSRPRSVSPRSLDCHFQAHSEFLLSTTCSQSKYYTVCRWVAI